LRKVLDLGEWWHDHTGRAAFAMGGNAIRRKLGKETISEVSDLLKQSIRYSLDIAKTRCSTQCSSRATWIRRSPIALWPCGVNDLTLDYSERGREAVRRLLTEGHKRGIIPHA